MMKCLYFENAIFADLEVLTKVPAYTNFRAKDKVIALAIPCKPLLAILNEQYPQLKKEILTKVSNRHREMKKILKEQIQKFEAETLNTEGKESF